MTSGNAAETPVKNSLSSKILVGTEKGVFENGKLHTERAPKTIYSFEEDETNPNAVYAATDKGAFLSADGGLNWYEFNDLEKTLEGAKVYQIKSSKSQNKLFISVFKNREGAVYETRGAKNFFTLQKIFDAANSAVYSLGLLKNELILGLGDGRLISYNLNTKELSHLASLGSPVISIFIDDRIYAATKTKGIFVSSGDRFANITQNSVKEIVLDNQKSIYIASMNQILKSSNLGRNWQTLPTISPPGSRITAIETDRRGRLFYAAGKKIYQSLDKGKKWKVVLETKNNLTSLFITKNDRIIAAAG